MTTTTMDTATTTHLSGPAAVLRVEALVLFAVGVIGFRVTGGTWGWFFALFLLPDLAFVGYLHSVRLGSVLYNATHSLIGPALLGAVVWMNPDAALAHLPFLWIAHIGFDRFLGYGLKYATRFTDTHLGRL